jgi:hypothetical protein
MRGIDAHRVAAGRQSLASGPALASGDGIRELVSVASRPGKPGFPQANRVTLTKCCLRDDSSGDGFGHRVGLMAFTLPPRSVTAASFFGGRRVIITVVNAIHHS